MLRSRGWLYYWRSATQRVPYSWRNYQPYRGSPFPQRNSHIPRKMGTPDPYSFSNMGTQVPIFTWHQYPLACVCLHVHHHWCPTNLKYLPPPLVLIMSVYIPFIFHSNKFPWGSPYHKCTWLLGGNGWHFHLQPASSSVLYYGCSFTHGSFHSQLSQNRKQSSWRI